MPTYTYRREDGTTFEMTQRITDSPLEKCPHTGQDVELVIDNDRPVVYNTDGFHDTDYK